MSFTGGYIFKQFEGAAEPVIREFTITDTVTLPLSNASVEGHPRQPWLMDRAELEGVYRASGCSLLFGNRFTTADDFLEVKRIIVNAVHNSPLDQSWKPEMHGEPALFSAGLRTLKALFPQAEIILAINKRNRSRLSVPEITETAVVREMSDRYPQELPALLMRHIGGNSEDDPSILVLSFEDMIQAAECFTQGKPFRDRIMLVAGPGVSKPGWYRIPLGASFGDIRRRLLKGAEHGPWRIIRGSLFSGTAVSGDSEFVGYSDTVITVIREFAVREFYRFINPGFDYDSYARVTFRNYIPLMKRRLDSNVHGGVRPCVQCNFCDEVCPSGLYPHLIWKHVQAGLIDESLRLRPQSCVECGLCDYVCPSKISISDSVKKARREFLERRKPR